MRFLCGFLAILTVFLLLQGNAGHASPQVASTMTWEQAAADTSYEDVRVLLHEVERLRVRQDIAGCSKLSPIPLYKDGPSGSDWRRYCEGIAGHDARICDIVPATINPDLRTLCFNQF